MVLWELPHLVEPDGVSLPLKCVAVPSGESPSRRGELCMGNQKQVTPYEEMRHTRSRE